MTNKATTTPGRADPLILELQNEVDTVTAILKSVTATRDSLRVSIVTMKKQIVMQLRTIAELRKLQLKPKE